MPSCTPDKLRNVITEGTIRAISLDANIFGNFRSDLKSPMLLLLDQFKGTNVSVIFSEIVVREVEKHIKNKAEQAMSKLRVSFQECQKRWRSNFDFDLMLQPTGIDANFDGLANRQFREFCEHVAAEVIPVNGNVNIDKLVDNYFNVMPPFEDKKQKKFEFPDAIALLSLEDWAKKCGNCVLLVSNDSGWQRFSELSDYLFCVKDLAIALDCFNEEGRPIVVQAFSTLKSKTDKTLSSEIDAIIQNHLSNNDFFVTAHSHLYHEGESYKAILQNWRVLESTEPHIIAFDRETVTFTIDLECTVEFTANFNFYFYDGIDREYTPAGNEKFSKKDDVQLSIFLKILKKHDPKLECVKVDITSPGFEVNFGDIEPDWRREE